MFTQFDLEQLQSRVTKNPNFWVAFIIPRLREFLEGEGLKGDEGSASTVIHAFRRVLPKRPIVLQGRQCISREIEWRFGLLWSHLEVWRKATQLVDQVSWSNIEEAQRAFFVDFRDKLLANGKLSDLLDETEIYHRRDWYYAVNDSRTYRQSQMWGKDWAAHLQKLRQPLKNVASELARIK